MVLFLFWFGSNIKDTIYKCLDNLFLVIVIDFKSKMDLVFLDGVLGLALPQMTLASSFLHSRQMVEVGVEVLEAVPETTFSLAALASDRDRVLERLNLEAASALTGLAMRDILVTLPAEKIVNQEIKSGNFPRCPTMCYRCG